MNASKQQLQGEECSNRIFPLDENQSLILTLKIILYIQIYLRDSKCQVALKISDQWWFFIGCLATSSQVTSNRIHSAVQLWQLILFLCWRTDVNTVSCQSSLDNTNILLLWLAFSIVGLTKLLCSCMFMTGVVSLSRILTTAFSSSKLLQRAENSLINISVQASAIND